MIRSRRSSSRPRGGVRYTGWAEIIRRFVAKLGDRIGVEVWAYHNAATEQWEIGFLIPGLSARRAWWPRVSPTAPVTAVFEGSAKQRLRSPPRLPVIAAARS